MIAKALDRVLTEAHDLAGLSDFQPFEAISHLSLPDLQLLLKKHGIGCHSLKAQAMYDLCRWGFDLKTVEATELERVHGIGCKTARFFILHTRYDAKVAALDTHMLHFMRDLGLERVPESTPGSRKQYRTWEAKFIELAERAQMSIADFDLAIWNAYSKKDQKAKDQLLNLVRRENQ